MANKVDKFLDDVRINIVELRPTDYVVIRFPGHIPLDMADSLRERMEGWLSAKDTKCAGVFVLTEGAQIDVLRPELVDQ